MKAIVYHEYGLPKVLKLEEVEKPIPTDDEILFKIYTVSVNRSDSEGLRGQPFYARIGGPLKPSKKILGSDILQKLIAMLKMDTQRGKSLLRPKSHKKFWK